MDLMLICHIQQPDNLKKILKIFRDNHFDIVRKTLFTVHLFNQNEEWVADIKLIAKELKRIPFKKEDYLQFIYIGINNRLTGGYIKRPGNKTAAINHCPIGYAGSKRIR